jgi:ferredoxin-NADP reductase/ferredoxin
MKEGNESFNLSIKGNIRDLLAFKNLISKRRKLIQKASSEPIRGDQIRILSNSLHPLKQSLVISDVKDESKSTKTYRLILDGVGHSLAYFRAGQYLSLKLNIDDEIVTRPYSISSSPLDSLNGFYEITIKKTEGGFVTKYIWDTWKVGTKIESSGPEGTFYYEPLRDGSHIVGIAGGLGITPFRSIAMAIVQGLIDARLTIFYGSSEEDDIIFFNFFKNLESQNPDKIKLIHILSCEEVNLEGCEKGFITAEIIEKYVDVSDCSFFICGPQVMYEFIDEELKKFDLSPKRIRKEVYGQAKEISYCIGYPKELINETFSIKIEIGNLETKILGLANESILVAMERAKLAPPSSCRSGSCGYCRSQLVSGEIFVNPREDGRRFADKNRGFFHPCSSYPVSDIHIIVPRSP